MQTGINNITLLIPLVYDWNPQLFEQSVLILVLQLALKSLKIILCNSHPTHIFANVQVCGDTPDLNTNIHMLLTNHSPGKLHPHARYLNSFSDILWLKISSGDLNQKDHIPSNQEKIVSSTF